jgi:hypothetical protein
MTASLTASLARFGADNSAQLLAPTGKRLRRGKLYLRLYHGRNDPNQEMDEWGFEGPTFGPLSAVVLTYLTTIRIYGPNPSHELWLETTRDMVRWQGKYFGDFEIFVAGQRDIARG